MIRAFVRRPDLFSRLVVMIQKEVADRIVSPPGGDAYGFLTLDVGAHASARRLFDVSRGDFSPPPKVSPRSSSSSPRAPEADVDAALKVASAGFTSRRKTLVNALTPLWGRERAAAAVAEARASADRARRTLGLDVFRALSLLGLWAVPTCAYNSSMSVSVGQAVLLGTVQGLTEFLPVSSTAHLALAQRFLPGFAQPGILFDVLLHVGTLAAVVVYFRERIARTFAGLASTDAAARRAAWRLAGLLVLAVALTGARRDAAEAPRDRGDDGVPAHGRRAAARRPCCSSSRNAWAARAARAAARSKRSARATRPLVGACQSLSAILHGFSRSGNTISVGLFSGLSRRAAAEFSFLLSIPTILAAAAVENLHAYRHHTGPLSDGCSLPGLSRRHGRLGGRRLLRSRIPPEVVISMRLTPFIVYCAALGLVLLVFGERSRAGSPASRGPFAEGADGRRPGRRSAERVRAAARRVPRDPPRRRGPPPRRVPRLVPPERPVALLGRERLRRPAPQLGGARRGVVRGRQPPVLRPRGASSCPSRSSRSAGRASARGRSGGGHEGPRRRPRRAHGRAARAPRARQARRPSGAASTRADSWATSSARPSSRP